jgi:hypothetical protein
MKESWTGTIDVRAKAKQTYARNLCLSQRIQYVQVCLLAKISYMAQVVPLNWTRAQLTTICTCFSWKEATFSVPITTLERPKDAGGWALPNIVPKCKASLFKRSKILGVKESSLLTDQMRLKDLHCTLKNPSAKRIPSKIAHLQYYALGIAYVSTDDTP